jgi:hypothetical protein
VLSAFVDAVPSSFPGSRDEVRYLIDNDWWSRGAYRITCLPLEHHASLQICTQACFVRVGSPAGRYGRSMVCFVMPSGNKERWSIAACKLRAASIAYRHHRPRCFYSMN